MLSLHSKRLVRKLDSLQLPLESFTPVAPSFELKDTLEVLPDGKQIKSMNLANVFIIKVPEGMEAEALIKHLESDSSVLYAEKVPVYQDFIQPDEVGCGICHYTDQWHLENTANPGRDIHAREAWNIYRGDANQIIGIFDGGIDWNHEDFTGKVVGSTTVDRAHGINVAGMAGAVTNNTAGVAGVNWYARLHNEVRSLTGSSSNYYNQIRNMAQTSGLNIINNSWGGTTYSQTIEEAFAYAYKRNRLSVAAMGNDGATVINFPAAHDEYVMAVGGTNNLDGLYNFSTRGNHIDVSAPAEDVWTTAPNDNYTSTSGTSFATPIVSGIASLLKGMKPELCNDDLKNLIEFSADEVAGMNGQPFTNEFGHGRVNAEAALELLMEPNDLVFRTATGGTVHSTSPWITYRFIGVTGLADAYYNVRRYEVRRTVTSQSTIPPAHVWGRGYHSRGFNAANPNFGSDHVDVVSVSGRNVTLRTYVYEVTSLFGQELGWYPTDPAGVKFAWAELYTEPGTEYADGFENGLGNSYNYCCDDIDWTIHSGSTPSSSTGPSSAYEGSDYAYVEASYPNYPNKKATLVFPGYNGLGRYRVQFKFHMYGADMGTLRVKYYKGDGSFWSSFQYSGDLGNQWLTFNKSTFYELKQLWLEFTTGDGFRSDIAIDDVQITRLEDYPVDWTDLVNVDPDGSSIFKTSGSTWWNAGAASNNVVPAYTEGWVETKITDYQSDFMFGFSYTNDNASWNTIDFNLYVSKYNGNVIKVYNRGTQVHTGTTYEVGDVVAVHRRGSTVYFLKNGNPFFTMTNDQSKSLVADICLYNGNLSLYDVRINHPSSGSSSSMMALASMDQFDESFGDPSLLNGMRPVGDDYPRDTVTLVNKAEKIPDLFKEFNVFPNESTGKFNVSYTLNGNSDLSLLIRDYRTTDILFSKEIPNPETTGEITFDISHMRDDTYFLEFNNGDKKHVVRIVKKSL